MPGGKGGRYLAPIGTSQFRFLFAGHRRQSNEVLRDSSVAWASCSRKVNDPEKAKFELITSRSLGSGGGVVTWIPVQIMQFKKPCSE